MPTKSEIRKEAKRQRDALEKENRAAAAKIIAQRLSSLNWFKAADQILLYLAIRSEVDTLPVARAAWAAGKMVYAPVVDEKNKGMTFYRFEESQPLSQGAFGVAAPSPVASRKADLSRPCLVVVPCLAFDRSGGRIGYGAGFYDRFLNGPARAWKRVALAYASQEITPAVPVEEHDKNLHGVVTEKEIILST